MNLKITFLMLFGFIVLTGCGKNDLCFGDEISRTLSPDQKVEVVVLRRDCGATTSSSYQISVVKAGNSLVENDIILIADKVEDLNVSWRAPKNLVISYKEARIFRFTNFWSSRDVDSFRYVISIVEVQRK